MNLVAAMQSAVSGWFDIFAGRQEWRERFDFTLVGLINGLVVYGFVALAAIFADQAALGLPSPLVLMVRLLIMALPVLALVAAVLLTRAILRFEAPALTLIVPAIYFFAVYMILSIGLTFIGPIRNPALLIVAAVVLYKEARIVANLSVTNSVAFALLTLVLLVALPASLYMLLAPGNGPI